MRESRTAEVVCIALMLVLVMAIVVVGGLSHPRTLAGATARDLFSLDEVHGEQEHSTHPNSPKRNPSPQTDEQRLLTFVDGIIHAGFRVK